MKRRQFLAGAALAGLALPLKSSALWAAPAVAARRKKVLYFTRSVGFEHSPVKREGDALGFSEKLLVELGKEAGFDVECTKDGRVFDESLDKWDVFAFYTCGDLTQPDKYNNPPMTPDGKKRFLDAVTAGKGYVGFHSANDSFHSEGPRDETQTVLDPYIAMVGGEFIVHGRQQAATVKITAPKFPGASGLGTSMLLLEEWYALKNFAKDLHVIVLQDTKGVTYTAKPVGGTKEQPMICWQETDGMADPCYQRPPFPATWARMHGAGRVFYTSFGHREDVWTNPGVQRIYMGGFAWALKNVDADIPANIAQVAPGANQIPKLPPRVPNPKPKKK